jgi:hypothetical protein
MFLLRMKCVIKKFGNDFICMLLLQIHIGGEVRCGMSDGAVTSEGEGFVVLHPLQG